MSTPVESASAPLTATIRSSNPGSWRRKVNSGCPRRYAAILAVWPPNLAGTAGPNPPRLVRVTHHATYPHAGANGQIGPPCSSTGRTTTQAAPIGHLRATQPGPAGRPNGTIRGSQATLGSRTDAAFALPGPPRQRAAGSHLGEGQQPDHGGPSVTCRSHTRGLALVS